MPRAELPFLLRLRRLRLLDSTGAGAVHRCRGSDNSAGDNEFKFKLVSPRVAYRRKKDYQADFEFRQDPNATRYLVRVPVPFLVPGPAPSP